MSLSKREIAENIYAQRNELGRPFDPALHFVAALVVGEEFMVMGGEFDKLEEAHQVEPEVVPIEMINRMYQLREEARPFVLLLHPFEDTELVVLGDEYGSIGDEVV